MLPDMDEMIDDEEDEVEIGGVYKKTVGLQQQLAQKS